MGEGQAEVRECLRLLRDSGFRGPFIIENYVWRSLGTKPESELRRSMDFIRESLGN